MPLVARWGSVFGVIFFLENPMIFDPWGQPWGPLEAEGRPQFLLDFLLFLHWVDGVKATLFVNI